MDVDHPAAEPPPEPTSPMQTDVQLEAHDQLASQQHHLQPTDSSLDPCAFRQRIRELQQTLLQASPNHASAAEALPLLLAEYARASQQSTLLATEWSVYLAALLQPHSHHAIGVADLQKVLDVHADSFSRLVDTRLVRLYLGLLLHYFGAESGIRVPLDAKLPGADDDGDNDGDDHDQDGPASSADAAHDPLHTWTGLQGGLKVDPRSSTYVACTLPALRKVEGDEADAAARKELLGIAGVRSKIRGAYSRCAHHLTESQPLWKIYLAFELALLASSQVDATAQTEVVKQAYLARLRVPHSAIDETFQAYSRFVTNHLPAESYEEELTNANKAYAFSKKVYSEREQFEDSLSALQAYQQSSGQPRPDPSTFATYWKPYLRWQQSAAARAAKGKDKAAAKVEQSLACGLFERAVAIHGTHPPASAEQEAWEASPPTAAWLDEQKKRVRSVSKLEKERLRAEGEQRRSERLSIAEGLWADYVATLHTAAKPNGSAILDVCHRSIHVLPTSSAVYATYMRQLTRFARPKHLMEDVFARIMGHPGIAEKGAALVNLMVARIDCEREVAARELAPTSEEGLEFDPATSMDKFMEIYALLSYGLGETAKLKGPERDASLRLERYAIDWVERAVDALGGPHSEAGAGLNELAESVWENAVKSQSANANVYRQAAAYWTRRNDVRKARSWYRGGVNKFERLAEVKDGAAYEQLLDDWVQFEHHRGRVEDIDIAVAKAKAERERMWEAWYASYATQQQQQQPPTQAQTATSATEQGSAAVQPTDAAAGASDAAPAAVAEAGSVAGVKRKPESNDVDASGSAAGAPPPVEAEAESSKKAKHPEEPMRDRENSSVLVSNLPVDVSLGALRQFLRDCGEIVEILGPRPIVSSSSSDGDPSAAALVEFSDRDGAASARTRDMKKLHERIVSVHLGWQCTVFVTNFPEAWDDTQMRRYFGRYGSIFDVRWPSRKYVATRRFVYLHYTRADEAAAAVEAEDGRRLEEDERCTLKVALSDPKRRKRRTDADNDEKELFVAGLPRGTVEEGEVRRHFEGYGEVVAVRMPRDEEGRGKGVAFVDFKTALDAQRAMKERNGSRFKGKVVAVTLVQKRGRKGAVEKQKPVAVVSTAATAAAGGGGEGSSTSSIPRTTMTKPAGGLNRAARRAQEAQERKSRTVHLSHLPKDAQEALIQQTLDQHLGDHSVRRVFYTPGDTTATVELADPKLAGRAAMLNVVYKDREVMVEMQARHQEEAKRRIRVPVSQKKEAAEGNGEAMQVDGQTGEEGNSQVDSEMAQTQEERIKSRKLDQDAFRSMLGRS